MKTQPTDFKLILGLLLMKAGRIKQWALGIAALAYFPVVAFAQVAAQADGTAGAAPKPWQLNMGEGVTSQLLRVELVAAAVEPGRIEAEALHATRP